MDWQTSLLPCYSQYCQDSILHLHLSLSSRPTLKSLIMVTWETQANQYWENVCVCVTCGQSLLVSLILTNSAGKTAERQMDVWCLTMAWAHQSFSRMSPGVLELLPGIYGKQPGFVGITEAFGFSVLHKDILGCGQEKPGSTTHLPISRSSPLPPKSKLLYEIMKPLEK